MSSHALDLSLFGVNESSFHLFPVTFVSHIHHTNNDLIDAPLLDTPGQPDPRTAAHLEANLLQSGGKAISAGLILFEDTNAVHQVKRLTHLSVPRWPGQYFATFSFVRCLLQQALKAMSLRFPWVKHNDASHAAAGDVVTSCVLVTWSGRKFVFYHLAYFEC